MKIVHRRNRHEETVQDGFTLVEMLVVIAIMSILMTAGAIGLGGIGGKGVTSGAATAESLFDEAKSMALGKKTRTRVLVAKTITVNPSVELRRIVIVYEEKPSTTGGASTWKLASRETLLPEQVYFSTKFSYKDQKDGTGSIPDIQLSGGDISKSYTGSYYCYEFNAEGICETVGDTPTGGGASFVIGNGTKQPGADSPKVIGAAKRDFGGFVVWRNGSTSVFRSPEQIGDGIKKLKSGSEF